MRAIGQQQSKGEERVQELIPDSEMLLAENSFGHSNNKIVKQTGEIAFPSELFSSPKVPGTVKVLPSESISQWKSDKPTFQQVVRSITQSVATTGQEVFKDIAIVTVVNPRWQKFVDRIEKHLGFLGDFSRSMVLDVSSYHQGWFFEVAKILIARDIAGKYSVNIIRSPHDNDSPGKKDSLGSLTRTFAEQLSKKIEALLHVKEEMDLEKSFLIGKGDIAVESLKNNKNVEQLRNWEKQQIKAIKDLNILFKKDTPGEYLMELARIRDTAFKVSGYINATSSIGSESGHSWIGINKNGLCCIWCDSPKDIIKLSLAHLEAAKMTPYSIAEKVIAIAKKEGFKGNSDETEIPMISERSIIERLKRIFDVFN